MEQQMDSVCLDVANRKKEFLNAMEKEFEPIINSTREQNNFDWSHLKRFYNNRKADLTHLYSLRIFCEFAFKLFLKFNCQDYRLVIRIIRIYQQVMNTYTELDICEHCEQIANLQKHYRLEDEMDSRSILKLVNKIDVDAFSYTNREFYGCLITGAVYVGNYAYLQFLVKYGLCYGPEDALYQVRSQLCIIFTSYVSLNPSAGVLEEREFFVDSILRLLPRDTKSLRRINLILLAVAICLCKRLGDFFYPDYAKCWNLYASTLPEAEISMKNVEDLLSKIWLLFENDEDFKNNTISLFKEVLPETPNLSSPRSLKYLCRCKVRYCIKKVPSLETVLSDLDIPITVKDYLLYNICN